MLYLTSATAVACVVRTGRIDSKRRRSRNGAQGSTREARLAGDSGGDEIAGRRAWDKDNESVAAPDAVATGGNGFDLERHHFRHQCALIGVIRDARCSSSGRS